MSENSIFDAREAVEMNSAIRVLVREIIAEELRALLGTTDRLNADGSAARVQRWSVPPSDATATPRAVAPERGSDSNAPRAPADPDQPNFDAAEAAWFLRYPTIKAFYHAVRRYGIPHSRKGERSLIFKRAELERFLASRSRFR